MSIRSGVKILLASAVLTTGASFAAPTIAEAVQLHELLFNRAKRQEQREKFVKPRATKPAAPQKKAVKKAPQKKVVKKAAPVKRVITQIQGPTYYTYNSPQIVSVSLATLVTLPKAVETSTLGLPNMEFEKQRFAEAAQLAPQETISVEADIADAVKAFYKENPKFIWSRGSSVTAEAKALVAILKKAGDHGLNGSDYAVNVPSDNFSLDEQTKRSAELLAFELQLSAHAVRYAMDMKDGAINPNKLSGYHDFSKDRLSAALAMQGLSSDANEAEVYLASLTPKQPHYAILQKELKALHGSEDNAIVFPENVLMKPGGDEEVLPLLMKAMNDKMRDETREKHKETIANYDGIATKYDGEIVELVRDVQRDLGLSPDGIVGPRTISRLGGQSVETKIERVELALERLRWHPEEYGKRQVVINQPEFRVRYMEGGQTKLAMRAVVGTPENQTYFFHDEIETVVFNPYWGVPQSIIVNEMLPRLHRDSGYLDRADYVVSTYDGKKIASSSVNWGKYTGPVPFSVRQKPGPNNALGELKILFPNTHAIYMHDTPAKNLFARDSRAYSHGCIRLEDPRAMAAAVLGKDISYVGSQLGGDEKGESLKEKIPVYVAYFTAWPDDAGDVQYFPDIYKRDEYLSQAINTMKTARNDAS